MRIDLEDSSAQEKACEDDSDLGSGSARKVPASSSDAYRQIFKSPARKPTAANISQNSDLASPKKLVLSFLVDEKKEQKKQLISSLQNLITELSNS